MLPEEMRAVLRVHIEAQQQNVRRAPEIGKIYRLVTAVLAVMNLVLSKTRPTGALDALKARLGRKSTRVSVVYLRPLLTGKAPYVLPVMQPPAFIAGVQIISTGTKPIRIVYGDDFGFRGLRFLAGFSGETGAGCDDDEGAVTTAPSDFFSVGSITFTS